MSSVREPLATGESPIPLPVLQEAAEWLLRFREGDLDEGERLAWRDWLAASDIHARAWGRAERLAGLLEDVPAPVGSAPLRQARRSMRGRRAVLSAFVGLLVGAPLTRLAVQREPWQYLQADLVTAIGERRQMRLDDGSVLTLNTDTRVALDFSARQRRLRLLRGELQVQAALDTLLPARPLLLQLQQASVLTQAARFAVRLWDDHARLGVEEGTVQLTLDGAGQATQVVQAGQQVLFDATSIGVLQPLQRNSMAWVQGALHATAMPLGELLAELARYRTGVVRCDPDIAWLPVSGVFQLQDTDTALALLQAGFPLKVRYRSRLWVMVEAA